MFVSKDVLKSSIARASISYEDIEGCHFFYLLKDIFLWSETCDRLIDICLKVCDFSTERFIKLLQHAPQISKHNSIRDMPL